MKKEHDDGEKYVFDSNIINNKNNNIGSAMEQKQPLPRNQQQQHRRESEREDWWLPRAESVASYIATKFAFSDIILLQEWWFDDKFTAVFDLALGDAFERVAERRPGADYGTMRDDGMCCLVRRKGTLDLISSAKILTGPQRIAQIIHCKERSSYTTGEEGRHVFIANSHLSFPGDVDPTVNDMRQAMEARIIADALTRAGNQWDDVSASSENERLEVICGDFNCNSSGLAASTVESPPYNFVNCASATAEQMLTHIGGQVNIGVTHCNHLGERVSVDHIFLRSVQTKAKQTTTSNQSSNHETNNRCSALALGYLDSKGTRILNVWSDDIHLEGSAVLSDHRPVTAKIAWPRSTKPKKEVLSSALYTNVTLPLDPLEPAWGIVVDD